MTPGSATWHTDHNTQVDISASYPSVTILCILNFSFNDCFYISAPSSVGPTVLFLPHPQLSTEHPKILLKVPVDLSRNSFNLYPSVDLIIVSSPLPLLIPTLSVLSRMGFPMDPVSSGNLPLVYVKETSSLKHTSLMLVLESGLASAHNTPPYAQLFLFIVSSISWELISTRYATIAIDHTQTLLGLFPRPPSSSIPNHYSCVCVCRHWTVSEKTRTTINRR